MSAQTQTWTPSSWRTKPVAQDVEYPDQNALGKVLNKISSLPPMVTPSEIERLRHQLSAVQRGEAFLLHAGDCAESFDACTHENISSKIGLILSFSLILIWGARLPVVRVGRIAGQYAKPRSSNWEKVDGREVLSFRAEFEKIVDGLSDALDFARTIGVESERPYEQGGGRGSLGEVDFYTSHEGLMLAYEEALTREFAVPSSVRQREAASGVSTPAPSSPISTTTATISNPATPNRNPTSTTTPSGYATTMGGSGASAPRFAQPARRSASKKHHYNTGAHFIWIGDRTRQLDHGHVEYFRGIRNPIGVKVGPSWGRGELVGLLD
ncbi:hypothetical protein DFP72DRAFT_1178664, partial [Ephemerocybe angulata]